MFHLKIILMTLQLFSRQSRAEQAACKLASVRPNYPRKFIKPAASIVKINLNRWTRTHTREEEEEENKKKGFMR